MFCCKKKKESQSDGLIGKWLLTESYYSNAEDQLRPSHILNNLKSIEFLPGNRFVEQAETAQGKTLWHTGVYDVCEKLMMISYEIASAQIACHTHAVEIAHQTASNLVIFISDCLPCVPRYLHFRRAENS